MAVKLTDQYVKSPSEGWGIVMGQPDAEHVSVLFENRKDASVVKMSALEFMDAADSDYILDGWTAGYPYATPHRVGERIRLQCVPFHDRTQRPQSKTPVQLPRGGELQALLRNSQDDEDGVRIPAWTVRPDRLRIRSRGSDGTVP